MIAIVAYETLFGNTRRIAEAVADGMRPHCQVTVMPVAACVRESLAAADLLVVGGPTHTHGVARPGTRKMAGVAAEIASAPGAREFLSTLARAEGKYAAAFDTRLNGVRPFTGAASRPIARRLRRAGYTLLHPSASFVVKSAKGPLLDGEIERATAWGESLAQQAGASISRTAA
ncbi:MAG: flavodoxin domain-containing protein [Candidatus Dormiibacterota bacterium]